MTPSIRHNASKNGIEISYPGKPNPKIIETLQSGGFKYSGKGSYWWSVITSKSLNAVNELADNPVCSSCKTSVNLIKRFYSLLGKEVDEPVLNPLHAEIRGSIKDGKSELQKELKEIDRLLWLMVDSARKNGSIVPQLGNSKLKKRLAQIAKGKSINTDHGQYALFGIPISKTKPEGKR